MNKYTAYNGLGNLSKLSRGDLESCYTDLHHKYHSLKKVVLDQVKEIRRFCNSLNIQIDNLEEGSLNRNRHLMISEKAEIKKINQLEHYNRSLVKKVQVLAYQLKNHSHLYLESHSCVKSIQNKSPLQIVSPMKSANMSDESKSRKKTPSNQEPINDIEDLTQKNMSVADLDISAELKLATNVSSIKTKRLVRKLVAGHAALTTQVNSTFKEIEEMKQTLHKLNKELAAKAKEAEKAKADLKGAKKTIVKMRNRSNSQKTVEESSMDCLEECRVLRKTIEKLLELTETTQEKKESVRPLT